MRYVLLAGSALLLTANFAYAQTPTTPQVPPAMSAAPPVTAPPQVDTAAPNATAPGMRTSALPAGVSPADRRFAETAGASGIAEVQAAQLAESKTSNAGVKDFANRMIQDHSRLNQQLMQVASALGLSVPGTPDTADAAAMEKLRGTTGAQFNRMYIRDQVRDHVKAIALFKNEASNGQNPQLKQLAQAALPTLQAHLSMARALREHGGAQG